MSRRLVSLGLALLLLAACGSTPDGEKDGEPEKEPESAGEPTVDPRARYLDEEVVLQARRIEVILPRALREDLEADSLSGGWEGAVFHGFGRVDVTVRKLRLLADEIEIRLTDGPIANLRVTAEGEARITTTTLERRLEPAELILLSPDRLLIR